MKKTFTYAFILNFIFLAVFDILWHTVILGSLYGNALATIARTTNGAPAPLIPFFLLGDVLFAFAFTYFTPNMGGDNSSKSLAMRGALLGALMTVHYTVVNHAVLAGWGAVTIITDLFYGIIVGLITSMITGYFIRKSPQSKNI
jgi:uncharacterized membrane protein